MSFLQSRNGSASDASGASHASGASGASGADTAGVAAAVNLYIDGYLGQEADTLRRAFHGDAKLITIEEGRVEAAPTAAWFDRIAAKRQGGSGPLTAKRELLGIDAAGAAAVAKVRLDFGTHAFVDYLSLLKGEGGWVIVNKIYTSFTPSPTSGP